MPGLVSTGKGIILANDGMVIVKTYQNSVSIRIYGTQRIKPIHSTLENSNQLQMHFYTGRKKLSYGSLSPLSPEGWTEGVFPGTITSNW